MRRIKLSNELISILEFVIDGKTSKEIAEILNYSKRSIDYRINKLFKIYKVKNRIELTKEYILQKVNIN